MFRTLIRRAAASSVPSPPSTISMSALPGQRFARVPGAAGSAACGCFLVEDSGDAALGQPLQQRRHDRGDVRAARARHDADRANHGAVPCAASTLSGFP